MIHLQHKCKVNFVKLPLIWIDLCLKLVFKNATTGHNTDGRSVVNCASCSLQLLQTISHQAEYITCRLVPLDAVHTRACMGIKKSPYLRNRPKSDTCLYELFLSQRPRKSPPAVISTICETPCIQWGPSDKFRLVWNSVHAFRPSHVWNKNTSIMWLERHTARN